MDCCVYWEIFCTRVLVPFCEIRAKEHFHFSTTLPPTACQINNKKNDSEKFLNRLSFSLISVDHLKIFITNSPSLPLGSVDMCSWSNTMPRINICIPVYCLYFHKIIATSYSSQFTGNAKAFPLFKFIISMNSTMNLYESVVAKHDTHIVIEHPLQNIQILFVQSLYSNSSSLFKQRNFSIIFLASKCQLTSKLALCLFLLRGF